MSNNKSSNNEKTRAVYRKAAAFSLWALGEEEMVSEKLFGKPEKRTSMAKPSQSKNQRSTQTRAPSSS